MVLLVGAAQAVPATGVAILVSSNNFTVPVAGAVNYAYVIWGQSAGNNNWMSENSSVVAGAANIRVFGAPLIGGRTVYYRACDSTGCGNERTVAIPAVTPLPVPTFGDPMRRIMNSHLAWPNITAEFPGSLTTTGAPIMLFYGISYVCVFAGLWLRTRTVRLSLIVGFLSLPLVVSAASGLYLGMPVYLQLLVWGMMAAALAGTVYGLMKKS